MIPDPARATGLEEEAAPNGGGARGKLGSLAPKHVEGSWYGWARSLWHALDAKPFPPKQRVFDRDLPELIRRWIVPGYAPEQGMLSAGDSIVTLGSCFARELRGYLKSLGFPSGSFWIPSGLNNTFAILDFVSWCVTGQETGRGYRYDLEEDGELREWTPEAEREQYVQGIRQAGAFVFTLGLAEVWQDRETGAVFWRGVPKGVYEAGRHEHRLTTVEENEQNVLRIVELIRSVNPAAPIVLTLSPVPLAATFRDVACIPADAVSKSVLRVALENVVRRRLDGVYYWPSFEVVRWAGAHVPWRAYGEDDGRPRNVTRYLVAQIIDAFVEAFYTPEAIAELRARRGGRSLPSPGSLRGRVEYPLRRIARRKRRRSAPSRARARSQP
jgi:hypothetical protein